MDNLNLDDLYMSYVSGESVSRIAKRLGVNRKKLSKAFVDNGFKLKVSPGKRLKPFNNDIKGLYESGESLLEISKKFNTTSSTIKTILVNGGVEIRTLAEQLVISKSADIDTKQSLELYQEGRSLSCIASLFGVAPGTIKSVLTANGIKIRSLSEQSLLNSDFLHPDIDLKHLHDLNKKGFSIEELGRKVGIKGETLKSRFIRNGFPIFKYKSREYRKIDSDETVGLFNDGLSTKALSEKFDVQRSTVDRFLKDNGVEPRGKSEAMINRMANTPLDERKKLTAKANSAVRGVKKTFEDLCKKAVGREKACKIYRGEKIAGEMINKLGVDTIHQKAVGPYNVDIFIPEYSVAVEIFGGHWHLGGRHASIFRKRFDYLINSKVIPIIVWVTKDFPFEISAAQKIISICQESCHNESMRSHEHVILGNGQCTTFGQTKLDYRS